MSGLFRQFDAKTRALFVTGNLSLVLGVLLWNFTRDLSLRHPWFDGVCGLFFGLSIGINLLALRKVRRRQKYA